MTVPNFITIARLLSVPLIVWLMIADRFLEATILFIIAGISDAADGFIAKRFGAASELGAYLDPIADKALLVSVFVTLGFKGVLPAWLIVLVVSRDLFIIGALMLSYMLGNPMEMRPLWVSKINTAAQILLHRACAWRALRRDDLPAGAGRRGARGRGLDRRFRRRLSHRMGPAHGWRARRFRGEHGMSLRLQAAFWIGALLFVLLFLWVFSGILLPFILGMALAYLLDPIADRLEAAGMSRFWATITIVLFALLVVALVSLIVVPILVSQLAGFLERLPTYAAQLQALGRRVLPDAHRPVFRRAASERQRRSGVFAGRRLASLDARLGVGGRAGASSASSASSW